jgi:hypothetical protein
LAHLPRDIDAETSSPESRFKQLGSWVAAEAFAINKMICHIIHNKKIKPTNG